MKIKLLTEKEGLRKITAYAEKKDKALKDVKIIQRWPFRRVTGEVIGESAEARIAFAHIPLAKT